jgi:hypothetical protein
VLQIATLAKPNYYNNATHINGLEVTNAGKFVSHSPLRDST